MRVYAVADIHGKHEKMGLQKVEPLVSTQTVRVTHTPPYGYQDLVMGRFHAGSTGLLKLINQCQPQVLICGHIHEDDGMSIV